MHTPKFSNTAWINIKILKSSDINIHNLLVAHLLLKITIFSEYFPKIFKSNRPVHNSQNRKLYPFSRLVSLLHRSREFTAKDDSINLCGNLSEVSIAIRRRKGISSQVCSRAAVKFAYSSGAGFINSLEELHADCAGRLVPDADYSWRQPVSSAFSSGSPLMADS